MDPQLLLLKYAETVCRFAEKTHSHAADAVRVHRPSGVYRLPCSTTGGYPNERFSQPFKSTAPRTKPDPK